MLKIRKNDEVTILTGKDKGKHGKVLSVLQSKQRVLVEGVNIVKKHTKGDPRTGTQGGIVQREASVHVSNVAIYNPVTKKADRVGFKNLEDGRKVRYFKSNNELIDI